MTNILPISCHAVRIVSTETLPPMAFSVNSPRTCVDMSIFWLIFASIIVSEQHPVNRRNLLRDLRVVSAAIIGSGLNCGLHNTIPFPSSKKNKGRPLQFSQPRTPRIVQSLGGCSTAESIWRWEMVGELWKKQKQIVLMSDFLEDDAPFDCRLLRYKTRVPLSELFTDWSLFNGSTVSDSLHFKWTSYNDFAFFKPRKTYPSWTLLAEQSLRDRSRRLGRSGPKERRTYHADRHRIRPFPGQRWPVGQLQYCPTIYKKKISINVHTNRGKDEPMLMNR